MLRNSAGTYRAAEKAITGAGRTRIWLPALPGHVLRLFSGSQLSWMMCRSEMMELETIMPLGVRCQRSFSKTAWPRSLQRRSSASRGAKGSRYYRSYSWAEMPWVVRRRSIR